MSTHARKLAARPFAVHPATLNGLPEHVRANSIETLSRVLAELLDVTLCVRHAYWNARGPDYLVVHELLEEIGGCLDGQADRIASRIRMLEGSVHRTPKMIVTESSFKPYPVAVADGQDHLEALAMRLGLLSAEIRLSIHESGGLLDPVTSDILTAVNAAVDHVLRLVEPPRAGIIEATGSPGRAGADQSAPIAS